MASERQTSREFLGRGTSFPLALDSQDRVAMAALEERVRQAILLILGTAKGERVMRPDFGCGIHNLVFAPLDTQTIAVAQREVEAALVRLEPRIEVKEVSADLGSADDGKLLISIRYRVRRTDTEYNMVYPFYVERGGV